MKTAKNKSTFPSYSYSYVELKSWYDRTFESLGWLIIGKENKDTLQIEVYKNHLRLLKEEIAKSIHT